MRKILFLIILSLFLIYPLISQTLTIYCEEDPPFQFTGADKKPAGMVVEMVQEIQKRIKNNEPIQIVPWARGYEEIQSKPNVVLFTMSRTAERNDLFQWVGPIAESAFAFYSKSGSKLMIKSLEDAKKVTRIGVYRNDVRDQFLTKAGFTNLERVDDNITNVKKLMADRIDMYVSSANNIADDLKTAGYKMTDVKLQYIFLKIQLYVAMSKNTDQSIVKSWNDALDAMKKDGAFKTIFKKYYPNNPLPGPAITKF